MFRSPVLDVSRKDGTPNGQGSGDLRPKDELDWTRKSSEPKRKLEMGDLMNPFDAASSSPSDLLLQFDPFASILPVTISLPQPELLTPMTPSRNVVQRNLACVTNWYSTVRVRTFIY